MRSDLVKKGFDKAPHRSLLRATGQIKDDSDFEKPFIGIANSYIDLIPGHVHLQKFGATAKEGSSGDIHFKNMFDKNSKTQPEPEVTADTPLSDIL